MADLFYDAFRKDFDRFLATTGLKFTQHWLSTPSCDVVDAGDKYTINADMPGVSKEDIKLNVSDSALEISARHREEQEEKKKNYVRRERNAISYERTIPLPEKVDSSKAKAKLNNGILAVEIPKLNPTPKSKSSQIQVQ